MKKAYRIPNLIMGASIAFALLAFSNCGGSLHALKKAGMPTRTFITISVEAENYIRSHRSDYLEIGKKYTSDEIDRVIWTTENVTAAVKDAAGRYGYTVEEYMEKAKEHYPGSDYEDIVQMVHQGAMEYHGIHFP